MKLEINVEATLSHTDALPCKLAGIKLIDDHLANSTYGLLMVYMASLRLTLPWLLTVLILFALLALVSLLGYTPTLNR
jgi:hypothetical protein